MKFAYFLKKIRNLIFNKSKFKKIIITKKNKIKMGDGIISLISDLLDSAEFSKLKTPNSFFFSEDTNNLPSDDFIDESTVIVLNKT